MNDDEIKDTDEETLPEMSEVEDEDDEVDTEETA